MATLTSAIPISIHSSNTWKTNRKTAWPSPRSASDSAICATTSWNNLPTTATAPTPTSTTETRPTAFWSRNRKRCFRSLAARGTLFENAYTNSPICVPARASFATGQYVKDCGYWDNADPYDGAVPSWGHRLIEQGHRVVSIGKLHYRDENDPNGFDQEIIPLHVVDGLGDLLGLIRDDMPERKGAANYARDVGPGESTYTNYDRNIAAETVRWLKEEAPKQDKPWVLFVSFVCPHFPLIAPPEFYEMYPEADIPWPAFYDQTERPKHPYYSAMRACINYDKYFDEAKVRKAVAGYLGLCSFMDHNVGKVLGAMDDATTRVIYTSDHGEALGKRGLWGKSTMFEEAAAIPLIMAGPGVPQGKRIETMASLIDCHPTIIESVGGTPHPDDATLPGVSLHALADGADADRAVFSEYHAVAAVTGNYMVRKGRWKLVWFVGMAPELLRHARRPGGIPRFGAGFGLCHDTCRDGDGTAQNMRPRCGRPARPCRPICDHRQTWWA